MAWSQRPIANLATHLRELAERIREKAERMEADGAQKVVAMVKAYGIDLPENQETGRDD